MADFLYSIDVAIFHFINSTISNSLFDKFFPFITEVKHWYLLYVILLGIVWVKGGRKGKIAVIGSIILITISDQFSSTFLKNWVMRIRPCQVLDAKIFADSVDCPSSFSFPSSHAVNNFAIAVFFLRLFPKYKWILLITAFLVALSRTYVGVHYPSDIFFGGLIGASIGYLLSIAALKTNEYFALQSYKKLGIKGSDNEDKT